MWVRNGKPAAVAEIRGEGRIRGAAAFFSLGCGVLVRVQVRGLPKNDSGFFALHIHEGRCCTGAGFADTGSHFNPEGTIHPRHAGDLPPLLSRNGDAFLEVMTDRFSLEQVIGRTLVIHSDADDFHTQPAGNAGRKIACGVIRRIGS